MDLHEWQEAIGAWQQRQWGTYGRLERASKLTEEIGEVMVAATDLVIANGRIGEFLVKTVQNHPKAERLNLGQEMADVFIVLLSFAEVAQIDLLKEVEKKVNLLPGWSDDGIPGIREEEATETVSE